MFKYLVVFLPSVLKIAYYRARGAKIGKNCFVGFTIINSKTIELGDNVQIASFNLIHRLDEFSMKSGSRMNGFNWITGAGTGSFSLGRNSAITRLHFFEASASIYIDDNTIIAGRNSHFFTHGISSTNLDDMRPIHIGPWCYIGSSSRFVPGAEVAEGTFVGMGSVVTKKFAETHVLLGGVPATIKKKLSPEDVYFNRPFLPHDHHPPNYDGGQSS
jgi:acetyltransferase-like isoleucine patch superfamily enzyme